MAYAGALFWNQFFRERRESGNDLDWGGRWTGPFLGPLRAAKARTVLELGCGTGNDGARMAREGYAVTALDVSAEAIAQARAKFGQAVRFLVADMAAPLPFPDESFDAVMSNVALHVFPDVLTRSVFAQVGRLVRPAGLFLFHVNALADRPLRARWRPVVRELETDYVLEQSGQTMHFFSPPTCMNSSGNGVRCISTRSRSRIGRLESRSSGSGAAWRIAEPGALNLDHVGGIRDEKDHLDDVGVYGRVTYELMARFWPTADKDPSSTAPMVEFARIWRDTPKIVFSRTLERADWNTTVVRDVVAEEVMELKAQPGGDMGLGGADIAAAFRRHDLIDEYRLYVHPILIGQGKPLFQPSDVKINLRLAETRPFGNGVVLLRYQRPDA